MSRHRQLPRNRSVCGSRHLRDDRYSRMPTAACVADATWPAWGRRAARNLGDRSRPSFTTRHRRPPGKCGRPRLGRSLDLTRRTLKCRAGLLQHAKAGLRSFWAGIRQRRAEARAGRVNCMPVFPSGIRHMGSAQPRRMENAWRGACMNARGGALEPAWALRTPVVGSGTGPTPPLPRAASLTRSASSSAWVVHSAVENSRTILNAPPSP